MRLGLDWLLLTLFECMAAKLAILKGPCRYMVYTWGPKGFPYTYFKAQVYPIYLHGPFGNYDIHDDGTFLSDRHASGFARQNAEGLQSSLSFRIEGLGLRV